MNVPIVVAFAMVLPLSSAAAQAIDWTANGRDVAGTRYSPAATITRDNVSRLQVAWTYRTGESGPASATATRRAVAPTRRAKSAAT